MSVLVHDSQHHRDVLHLSPLQVCDKCLAVEWIVGVFDGLGPELGDGGGWSPSQ